MQIIFSHLNNTVINQKYFLNNVKYMEKLYWHWLNQYSLKYKNIKLVNNTSCCSGGCALLGAHKMVFFGVRAAPPPLCSKNSCENSDSLSLSSRVATPGFPSSVFSRRRQIYNGYLFHEVDYMHINAGCCQAAAAGEGGRRADDGERWRETVSPPPSASSTGGKGTQRGA